jgi:hypothetical protein
VMMRKQTIMSMQMGDVKTETQIEVAMRMQMETHQKRKPRKRWRAAKMRMQVQSQQKWRRWINVDPNDDGAADVETERDARVGRGDADGDSAVDKL